MYYIPRKRWQIAENQTTSEALFLSRRSALKAMGLGLLSVSGLPSLLQAEDKNDAVFKNPSFQNPGRPITPEATNLRYNNYYEFGNSKSVAKAAQALSIRPWTIEVSGLVAKPKTFDIDDLLTTMPLEERIYRHRCVEAWSMVVPWTGFELSTLLAKVEPLSKASYVHFEGFVRPKEAPRQKQSIFNPWSEDWPYSEGLTLAEANNPLALLVTGAYGKPLAKQMGAPLRLHLPWKYGFKSIKGITKIILTDQRPVSFWQKAAPNEYGFWANVNPKVPHRRWSQARERDIESGSYYRTRLFNGYAEEVADLYKNLKKEALYF